MASIQTRRSKGGQISYRVRICRKGYPPVSATFLQKTAARRFIEEHESAVRDGRYFQKAEAAKHTLAEAIDRFVAQRLKSDRETLNHQKHHLAWFRRKIGHCLLSNLTPAALSECKRELLVENLPEGRPRKGATANRYLASLSAALRVACEDWMWCDVNPLRMVRREADSKFVGRFLSDEERNRLLDAAKADASPHIYPVVVLAIATGMRRGEIKNLRWREVDLKRGVIILERTKNGEKRRVPLGGLPRELLLQQAKVRRLDSDLVFPSSGAKAGVPFELDTAWQRVRKRAGLQGFRFHDCRHTTASYLAMQGASLVEIAEILGHKSMQMVKRYAHFAEGHTGRLVEEMNKKIFG
jgi:integrase